MFSNVKELTIPEGKVRKIEAGGKTLWKTPMFNYVSLGDSIAAGHFIRDEDYLTGDENWKWQHGETNNEGTINTSTTIISGSYTDQIMRKLWEIHGQNHVHAVSYAHSGDENYHTDAKKSLRTKLDQEPIASDVAKADLITVCIGANTMLSPALDGLKGYAAYGAPALSTIEAQMDAGLAILKGDVKVPGSYLNIFARIANLNKNPDAKFVFTTIYNPYKYLWLDEGTDMNNYSDSYFSTLLDLIPDEEATIPGSGEIDLRKFVYEIELGGFSLKKITQRINDPYENRSITLAQWIEDKILDLNEALLDAVAAFGDSRFIIADTKTLFESIPDYCIVTSGDTNHYANLISVEFNRTRKIANLNWGNFWTNFNLENVSGIADAFGQIKDQIIQYAVMPDMDPHPEENGHTLLYHSFADAIGLETGMIHRYTLTYNANGGSTSKSSRQVAGLTKDIYVPFDDVTFTKSGQSLYALEYNGTKYGRVNLKVPYIYFRIKSNSTIKAVWGYSVTYYKSRNHDGIDVGVPYTNDNTGPDNAHALYFSTTESGPYTEVHWTNETSFNGITVPPKARKCGDPKRSVVLLPGTWIKVWVKDLGGDIPWDKQTNNTHIRWNGSDVKYGGDLTYSFKLTCPIDINFVWYWRGATLFGNAVDSDNEWQCNITTK